MHLNAEQDEFGAFSAQVCWFRWPLSHEGCRESEPNTSYSVQILGLRPFGRNSPWIIFDTVESVQPLTVNGGGLLDGGGGCASFDADTFQQAPHDPCARMMLSQESFVDA